MYNFLTKNGQLIAFGVGLLITIIYFVMVTGGLDAFNALPKEERGTTGIFNFGLWIPILFIIAGIAAMLFFGVMQIASNPKGSMRGLMGIGALILIFVVCYSMASGELTGRLPDIADRLKETAPSTGEIKFVDGAVKTTGIVILISILVFAFSEIRNLFK